MNFGTQVSKKIKDFYKSVGYKHNIDSACTFIGAFLNEEIIGLVRICPEGGVLMLRGMQVKPGLQQRNIGKKMLVEVSELLKGKECYGIPYDYLENFYGLIGFKKIAESEAPEFLQKRIESYRKKRPDKDFIIIKKSAIWKEPTTVVGSAKKCYGK